MEEEVKETEKMDELDFWERRKILLAFLKEATHKTGFHFDILEQSVPPFEAEAIGILGNPREGSRVLTGKIFVCFAPDRLPHVTTFAEEIGKLQGKIEKYNRDFCNAVNQGTRLINEMHKFVESGDISKKAYEYLRDCRSF